MKRFIRVVDVRPAAAGLFAVSFYEGDEAHEALWSQSAAPGDVFEEKQGEWVRVSGAAPGAFSPEGDVLRWRKPATPGGPSRLALLKKRHAIRAAARAYLDGEGFTEIDAPLLLSGTTPDPSVESFAVGDFYLATSTEYPMKRLAVGGFEKIYSLTQNFRDDAAGSLRNPEFTMLEWGRVGASMREIEADIENIAASAMARLGLSDCLVYQGKTIEMKRPWPRWSVAEAVERLTGVPFPDFEAPSCIRALEALGVAVRSDWAASRDFLFSLLMDSLQPHLGAGHPVFLTDWPLYQTTSAAEKGDGTLADRSELFVAGLELADGFAGLADFALHETLFAAAQEARRALGQKEVAFDKRYLASLKEGAPYGAGMAMGFDRLCMLLLDQAEIKNVLAFTLDELR